MLHILCVETIPKGEVGGEYLDPDEVVPGHTGLREHGGESREEEIQFTVDLWGSDSGCRISSDATGKIKRVADQYSVAERQVRAAAGKINDAACVLCG
jgi:hypothetical protein